jgi:hypothetical protein
MSRRRFFVLAVAALLAIVGAMYLSTQRNLPRDVHGGALLPALANELGTVTTLSLRKGSATPTLTLHEQGGRWTVTDRGDYPADVTKLRRLLLALNDARIVEEKTSNPASFPVIGVEDPALPGATGTEITITAPMGKLAVIVGKPTGEGNFVRRGGENTSYVVQPGISFEAEPRYWIDSRLLDIAAPAIQSIEIKPPTGPSYTVRRARAVTGAAAAAGATAAPGTPATPGTPAASSATNFTLDTVPHGRKAADAAALAPSPTTYSGLTADDVTPVGGVDFSKATVATLTTADGNVLTLTGVTIADKHWIQVQATKDADLNAKAAGRAFEISGYRYDAIFRPLEQLLVPKEPSPGAKAALKPALNSSAAKPKKPVPEPTP